VPSPPSAIGINCKEERSWLFFNPFAMHLAASPAERLPLKAFGAIMIRISNVKKIFRKRIVR
jgi:hypothetical protein